MHKYLFRLNAPAKRGGALSPSSYHLIDSDGKTSICGAVKAGVQGYEIVEREFVLRARRCANCRSGRVTRP